MRMFPIMTDHRDVDAMRKTWGLAIVVAMPWPQMVEHEARAIKNHDQDIEELAARGGLSACEALAVLEERPWREMPIASAHARLKDLFGDWYIKNRKALTS